MSLYQKLLHLAEASRAKRDERRARAIIAALPPELQRDLGWPVMDTFTAVRTRIVPR